MILWLNNAEVRHNMGSSLLGREDTLASTTSEDSVSTKKVSSEVLQVDLK